MTDELHTLLDRLGGRIVLYTEQGVPDAILDEEALAEAASLILRVRPGVPARPDRDAQQVQALWTMAVWTVAWLHWARQDVVHPDLRSAESHTALAFFRLVGMVDPERVPAGVRELFERAPAFEPSPIDMPECVYGDYLAGREPTGESDHLLDLTIEIMRDAAALAAVGSSESEQALRLLDLADALSTRFEHEGLIEDVDDAVVQLQAATGLDSGAALEHRVHMALSWAHLERAKQTGSPTDADRACELGRSLVATATHASPDRIERQLNLVAALATRFRIAGQVSDLAEAIALARSTLDQAPEGHELRSTCLSNLAVALQERAKLDKSPGDATEAVDLLRAAVRASTEPDRGYYLSNLGIALSERFELSRSLADIAAAITTFRDVVSAARQDRSDHLASSGALATALLRRYVVVRSPTDLDEAIDALEEHAAATPAHQADDAVHLANLATALYFRFQQSGERDHIDAAVEAGREVVELTAESRDGRARSWSNLAGALRVRAERFRTVADIAEAIELSRRAVEDADDLAHKAVYLSNLGGLHLVGHDHFSDAGDHLEGAMSAFRDAVAATPVHDPHLSRHLSGLANALIARFGVAQRPDDLTEAVSTYRAAALAAGATPLERAKAAKNWAWWSAEREDWTEALNAISLAVELLPQLAWHGLDRGTREELLKDWEGTATAAAAHALSSGQPHRAVELLERGRSVLWSQILRTRDDFTTLREAAPELWQRLTSLATELNSISTQIAGLGRVDAAHLSPDARPENESERRMRLADEWDRTLADVRRVPGAEHLVRGASTAEIQENLPEDPVVIVNVSRYRCDALIVCRDSVRHLPLDDLSEDDVNQRATDYLRAMASLTGRPRDHLAGVGARHTVLAVLEWLWTTIAEPVLDFLDYREPAPGQSWPRVWWCPTGSLTALPLHAAGHHDAEDSPAVLNRVVSSYTATLRALTEHRREEAPDDERDHMLLIGLPSTPPTAGFGTPAALPGVPREVDIVSRHFRGAVTSRVGEAAAVDQVVTDMPRHRYAHFACHGVQDMGHPSTGTLLLHDGPLTLSRIAELQLRDADLVFLSACQTALGGARLADESISLAAAFQLAGYRHVIATMWTIADQPAPQLADDFYAALCTDQRPSLSLTSYALHTAVRRLRATCTDRPTVWAHYIHVGP